VQKQLQLFLALQRLLAVLLEQLEESLLRLACLGLALSEVVLVAVVARISRRPLVRLAALEDNPVVVAVAVLLPTMDLPLVLAVQAVLASLTLSPIANLMITDSHNITWTPSEDRSLWTGSDGSRLMVNPASNDEQVLSSIEQMYVPAPIELSDSDRIAELEAQVKALLAKLS
jgi:hypothetical protein